MHQQWSVCARVQVVVMCLGGGGVCVVVVCVGLGWVGSLTGRESCPVAGTAGRTASGCVEPCRSCTAWHGPRHNCGTVAVSGWAV